MAAIHDATSYIVVQMVYILIASLLCTVGFLMLLFPELDLNFAESVFAISRPVQSITVGILLSVAVSKRRSEGEPKYA